jgi:hypothetical protein
MAGFAQIGERDFRIAPPRIASMGAGGFMPLSISAPPTRQAGFFGDQLANRLGAESNPEHMMNVFLARAGLGNTGRNNFSPAESPYGFSGQDFNTISSFMLNPLHPANAQGYQSLINRMSPAMQSTGQFANYEPERFNQTMTDLPIRMGLGFGTIPPPVLQNLAIGLPPGVSGMRF